MVWMTFIVPMVITALVLLFVSDFLLFASEADIHCPVCKSKFNDVFDLRRHMKGVEAGKGDRDERKAA